MVMKDKLEKTNHKGTYYLIKKMSIALLILSSVIFTVAIPTYIISMSKKKNIGIAQYYIQAVVHSLANASSQKPHRLT